jgi:hypothetical protein
MRKMGCFITLFVSFLLCSCGGSPVDRQTQVAEEFVASDSAGYALTHDEIGFMENLARFCGSSFRGRETYFLPGRESWADKEFVMHVVLCEVDRVHIPFHLDDDTSRTWMFLLEDGRLRFRHDHRHPDGTPEELTMYGGYADGSGSAYAQSFPADDYTIDLLTDTLGRQWNIVMDELLTNFSYQLQYGDKIVFQADFDLTNPL